MATLEYLLQRYYDNRKSTLGLMFKRSSSGLFHVGHTLEDEYRDVKVSGETRIPAGKYELKLRKVESPATVRYRKRYPDWFVWHVELQGVPGFKYIYVHPGVNEDWTDGCVLLSDGPQTINGNHSLSASPQKFKEWYTEVYDHLMQGGRAYIEVRDEGVLK